MSTLVADKKSLKPLGIIIAAFNIVLALYSLLIFLALCLNNTLDGVLPKNLTIGGAFPIISNIIDIIQVLATVLLLIWFILVKGHINNGARVVAIIGLSILIAFDIFATITNICFSLEERGEILFSNVYYIVINTFFTYANLILIGVAFIVMGRQLGKGAGSWAMANGIVRLIQLLVSIINTASNFILTSRVPIQRLISIHQFNYTLSIGLTLVYYITIIIFFFKFSLKEDK